MQARCKGPGADLGALSGEGGARLDLPDAVADGVQVEPLGDLGGGRGRQQVLLVGEDEDRNAAQLLLIQQLRQLLKGTNSRRVQAPGRRSRAQQLPLKGIDGVQSFGGRAHAAEHQPDPSPRTSFCQHCR